jgi:hypothetical protein
MRQVLIFLLLFLSSCSTLEFNHYGRQPFAVYVLPEMAKVETKEGVCDFFFWGYFPNECVMNLEKEFKYTGIIEPSLVRVSQNYSILNVAFAIFTLGIYAPVNYQVSVYSKKELD